MSRSEAEHSPDEETGDELLSPEEVLEMTPCGNEIDEFLDE